MIPSAFIFEQRMPVAIPRWDGLGAFLAIGVGAALFFVMLIGVLASAYPEVPAWELSALGFASLLVPVYLLHRRFAFGSGTAHERTLPRYILVQLATLFAAALFSFVAYGAFGLDNLTAALLVIGVTSVLNFVVLRAWAFSV